PRSHPLPPMDPRAYILAPRAPLPTPFPYTTLFRSYKGHSMSDPQKYRTKEEVAQYEQHQDPINRLVNHLIEKNLATQEQINEIEDRKSTRLNSSHVKISYAVFCLKKKNAIKTSRAS